MGLDEVGRGCLAGPVVAAGVIFPPDIELNLAIRDSKKMKETERVEAVEWIKQKALFWHIAEASPEEIDQINILQASLLAMQRCVDTALAKQPSMPDYLLVDGNRFGASLIPFTCVVKGDDRSMSIGAASILAKVYRDALMADLHQHFPVYGWNSNVGYPTPGHKAAIAEHGRCMHHRMSFKVNV